MSKLPSQTQTVGKTALEKLLIEAQKPSVETVIGQAMELLEAAVPFDAPTPGAKSMGQAAKEPGTVDFDGLQITLSSRELQVLKLVAEGLSNQEIADRLYITERTVRFHVTSIFNKLGVNNRTHAVSLATRLGLLQ